MKAVQLSALRQTSRPPVVCCTLSPVALWCSFFQALTDDVVADEVAEGAKAEDELALRRRDGTGRNEKKA